MSSTSKYLLSLVITLLISCSIKSLQAQSEYFDKDYGTDGIATIDLPLDFSWLTVKDFTVNFDSLDRLYISHFIATGATRRILRLDTLGQVDTSFGDNGYLWESDYITLHKDNYIFLTKMLDNATIIKVLDLEANLLLRVIVPYYVDINNLSYEDKGFLVGTTYNLICFRYNSEGLLDLNFGEEGLVHIIDPPEIPWLIMSNTLVRDKSANAYYIYFTSPYFDGENGVSRIDSNGQEEKYFSKELFPTFFMDNSIQFLTNTTLHDDNSLIVSGEIYWTASEEDSFYLKLKSDKTIDTDFGENGLILLPSTPDDNLASRIIIGQFSNANLAMIEEQVLSPETFSLADFSILDKQGQIIEDFGDNGLISLDDIPGNNKLSAVIKGNSLYIMSFDDSNLRQIHITKINPFDNETSIVNPQLLPTNHISLYPNPTHQNTQWLYTGPNLGPTRLSITDSQGQVVTTRKMSVLRKDTAIDIDTENLAEGTYIIQLAKEGQVIKTEKLVVQH